ncbi:MAG: hypothetical protein U1E17_02640 [Geminicoccaceae bacterium]
MSDKPAVGRRRKRGTGKDPEELDEGFDRFLNRQLHQLFDPILAEPVPSDLMKLIEQFEEPSERAPQPDGAGHREE